MKLTKSKEKKSITLNDLAAMVAKGFEHTASKEDIKKLETRIDGVENRMGGLEVEMKALKNNVKNYLELSDKRYLELKHRDKMLMEYLKELALKTQVKMTFKELETF